VKTQVGARWRRPRSLALVKSRLCPLMALSGRSASTAPLGGDPRADDIDSVAMTNKAILLHGNGIKQTDRTWSAVISLETGNVTAGVSILDSSLFLYKSSSVKLRPTRR
jgi:hypothetical protein